MSEQGYEPPKVWKWEKQGGGKFTNINRPVSGATHKKGYLKVSIPYSYIHWRLLTALK